MSYQITEIFCPYFCLLVCTCLSHYNPEIIFFQLSLTDLLSGVHPCLVPGVRMLRPGAMSVLWNSLRPLLGVIRLFQQDYRLRQVLPILLLPVQCLRGNHKLQTTASTKCGRFPKVDQILKTAIYSVSLNAHYRIHLVTFDTNVHASDGNWSVFQKYCICTF